jgi:hypothetical protein
MGRRGALVGLHGAVLLFGFAGLFGKWLLLPPVWIVLGRTAVAAAALSASRDATRCAPSSMRPIANGAAQALHWVAFFAAIQISSVAIGPQRAVALPAFRLFVLLAATRAFGRQWTGREAAVALFVTLGLTLLVPEISLANPCPGPGVGVLSGFTFASSR